MIEIRYVDQKDRHWFTPFLPQELREEPDQVLYGAVDAETGTAVGAVAAVINGAVVDLEWMGLGQDWTGRGIARKLIRNLVADCASLPELYEMRAIVEEKDAPEARVLRHCGFVLQDSGDHYCRFALSDALEQPLLNRSPEEDRQLVPVQELPESMVRAFNAKAEASLELVVPEGRLIPEHYDPELSLCTVNGAEITALLLASRSGDRLLLDYLYAQEGCSKSLLLVLQSALHKAAKSLPGATEVQLMTVNEAAERLARKLLPNCTMTNGWTAVRTLHGGADHKGGN